MEITLRLQRLGKKRVRNLPYKLDGEIATLTDLITACVRKEVERFNTSREEPEVLPFLGPEAIGEQAIGEQARAGKVSFNRIENTQVADAEKAITVATQAWSDGMYAVFVNDEEIMAIDAPLSLPKGTTITFLRLTFLTGTFW